VTDKFIQQLGRARLAAQPIPDFDRDDQPTAEDEGYRRQAELAEWFRANGKGARAGYKIGATAPAMRAYLGVDGPGYGHIMAGNMFKSGVEIPGNTLFRPGIECEIAVRIAKTMTPRDEGWSRAALGEFIDAVAPAIEIVENRYDDFRATGIGTLIADDFFHKCCVLGPFTSHWQAIDLPLVSGRITIDGDQRATGEGEQVMGHPLEPVVWLAETLRRQGRQLEAGEIVLTGSMTPVIWIDPVPSTVEIKISKLGRCGLSIT